MATLVETKGTKRIQLTESEIENIMFGTDHSLGFCIMCGEDQHGVEPDARNYVCECCDNKSVFGHGSLLEDGLIEVID